MMSYTVFELRAYRVDPQRREEFIDHFEQYLTHPQEALGIGVLGQFELVGEPDRFVWIRAFADMAQRRRSLTAFYGDSHAWREHGPLANDIMREWDDVYLLRPTSPVAAPTADYRPDGSAPPRGRPQRDAMVVVAVTNTADDAADPRADIAQEMSSRIRGIGGRELASFTAEPTPNDFPRLPVRQAEGTVVSFAAVPRTMAQEARRALVEVVGPDGRVLLLDPTERSLLP